MKDLLKKFENKEPVIVLIGKMETEAEGWTVINSLRWCCRRWNQDEKRTGHQ
jgi:hypothetical protein